MRIVRPLFLFLFVFAFSVQALMATGPVPNAPREFSATGTQIQGTTNFNVTLMWLASSYDNNDKKPLGYHIYMADTATENLALFRLIGTDSTADSADVFRYVVEHLGPGTYTFFIRAFNNNGESDRTPIKVLTLVVKTETNRLAISSTPGTTVQRGGTYYYHAQAHNTIDSSKNSHIRYKIISGPDGMTIDSITGEIHWTAPNANKVVSVKILAYLDNDDSVKSDQSWNITVGDGNNNNNGDGCAMFVGNVRDTSGNAMNGTVRLYRVDSLGQLMDGYITVTLVNGHFTRRVPAGTYVLRAQGDGFEYEWYNNAKEPSDAERFTINCNDTTEVNFEVVPLAQEQKYVFSGHVSDAQSGNAATANLYFYPIINGTLGTPVTTKTNGDGNYEIQLSNRYNYIAKAAGSDDFLPLYYNNVGTSAQATVLVCNQNRSGINFALPRRQSYNNSFAGQMVDSAAHGVSGRVTAYMIVTRNNDQGLQAVRTVETDASGNWSMSNLTPGNYVLQGIPGSRPFVPGYYKDGQWTVNKWSNGTTLTLDSITHTSGLVIKMRTTEGRHGIVVLKGTVHGIGGITKNGNPDIQGAVPLGGVLVMALDNNGKISDYAFTNSDGTYTLNDLSLGMNTVVADRPGYTASQQDLNFDGQNFVIADNIQLSSIISSVGEELVSNSSVAPNPASSTLRLNFEAAEGPVQVSILNGLGMEMSSNSQYLVNGQNSLNFDVSTLAPGTYFVRLNMGSKSSVVKFSVVR